MKKLIKNSLSVFYPNKKNNYLFLSKRDAEFLKSKKNLLNSKSRICSHLNKRDKIHEMLIYHKKDAYVRPHKHLNKIESFNLISGTVDLIIFKNNGKIYDVINMGDYSSKKIFYYKMYRSCYHTLLIKKDAFFHEVTSGPFKKKETVYPTWAPDDKKKGKVKNYLTLLSREVKGFKK